MSQQSSARSGGSDSFAFTYSNSVSVGSARKSSNISAVQSPNKPHKPWYKNPTKVFIVIAPHLALVVALSLYTYAGSTIIIQIEAANDLKIRQDRFRQLQRIYNEIVAQSWQLHLQHSNDTVRHGVSTSQHDEHSKETVQQEQQENETLTREKWSQFWQEKMKFVSKHHEGEYMPEDATKIRNKWTLQSTLLYTLTMFCASGYDRLTAYTVSGQVFMFGATLVGIPLLFITAADLGKGISEVVSQLLGVPWKLIRKQQRQTKGNTVEKSPENAASRKKSTATGSEDLKKRRQSVIDTIGQWRTKSKVQESKVQSPTNGEAVPNACDCINIVESYSGDLSKRILKSSMFETAINVTSVKTSRSGSVQRIVEKVGQHSPSENAPISSKTLKCRSRSKSVAAVGGRAEFLRKTPKSNRRASRSPREPDTLKNARRPVIKKLPPPLSRRKSLFFEIASTLTSSQKETANGSGKERHLCTTDNSTTSNRYDGASTESDQEEMETSLFLAVTAYVGLILGYALLGGFLYSLTERLGLISAFHFAFRTITTIGLGDVEIVDWLYLGVKIAYIIVGISVVSLCVDIAGSHVSAFFDKIHYFGRTVPRDTFAENMSDLKRLVGSQVSTYMGRIHNRDQKLSLASSQGRRELISKGRLVGTQLMAHLHQIGAKTSRLVADLDPNFVELARLMAELMDNVQMEAAKMPNEARVDQFLLSIPELDESAYKPADLDQLKFIDLSARTQSSTEKFQFWWHYAEMATTTDPNLVSSAKNRYQNQFLRRVSELRRQQRIRLQRMRDMSSMELVEPDLDTASTWLPTPTPRSATSSALSELSLLYVDLVDDAALKPHDADTEVTNENEFEFGTANQSKDDDNSDDADDIINASDASK